MDQSAKKYPTFGCCGLDCGLCPRYYTSGNSRCPGCMGENFAEKHPACGILSCRFKKQGLECCGECNQYPCDKIKPWASGDSFISHQVCLENLNRVRSHGLQQVIQERAPRIEILHELLERFDDGKSKSFFCLAAALIPPEKITEFIQKSLAQSSEMSVQVKFLKELLQTYANQMNIELRLRK